jgi:hypothetical protein
MGSRDSKFATATGSSACRARVMCLGRCRCCWNGPERSTSTPDHTRILSLGERALRKLIGEDAAVAAALLFNASKMMCVRLIKAN